jgi:hypothetical protein
MVSILTPSTKFVKESRLSLKDNIGKKITFDYNL